jgi:hypothetical protein
MALLQKNDDSNYLHRFWWFCYVEGDNSNFVTFFYGGGVVKKALAASGFFFLMLKIIMAKGRRLKKGGGDLKVHKKNVTSSERTIIEQNVASSK